MFRSLTWVFLLAFGFAQRLHGATPPYCGSTFFPGECLYRVVPVVISSPGAYGSFFRTEITLISPYQNATGRLVFHPIGQRAALSDPALEFHLQGVFDLGQTTMGSLRIPDVVAAVGSHGLGSLDVLISRNAGEPSGFPVVFANVYNDEGVARPMGSEEVVDPSSAAADGNVLSLYYGGFLVAPPDPNAYRFAIGIRTLQGPSQFPCQIGFRLFDLARSATFQFPVAVVLRDFAADSFFQIDLSSLFGVPIPLNAAIEIAPNPSVGCATIGYGVTVENRTNSPTFHVAKASHFQTF